MQVHHITLLNVAMLVPFLSFFILCNFMFLLQHISEASILLFISTTFVWQLICYFADKKIKPIL